MEPVDNAKHVIDSNKYMVLGTTRDDGSAWVTPVYYTPDGYHRLYWLSNPDSVHSHNIAARPRVQIVVFDSSVRIGGAQAVYMAADTERVPEAELAVCAEVFSARFPELSGYGPAQMSGSEPIRLYRANVISHEVLVRGSDPLRGKGTDSRFPIEIPGV